MNSLRAGRIHHLNCGSIHPYLPRVRAIVYCLLVETNQGLVLVDTGFGIRDRSAPTPAVRRFMALLRVPAGVEETAAHQVAGLGFAVEDVRHIVLTHLHLDHAGGLPDFPRAQVHVYRLEHSAAMRRRGPLAWTYRPEHWAHGPRWVLHDPGGEEWFGFPAIRILPGLEPDTLLVPLPGHTRGHCGVAVRTAGGWLFHCGDAASPFVAEANPNADAVGRAVNAPLRWLAGTLLGPHVPRLRELARAYGDKVRLISGHDIYQWQRFSSPARAG